MMREDRIRNLYVRGSIDSRQEETIVVRVAMKLNVERKRGR